jgi:CheY-like chemotaxis protein
MTDTMKSDSSEPQRVSTTPASAGETNRSPSVGAVKAGGGAQHKCVLLVDRNADALAGLGCLLESMGYGVAATCEHREALEIAGRRLPDAALIDIGAPQLEGLSLARDLREIAGKRPLLLVALTGWGQPQYREMALEAGFDVHWVKPVSPDQLNFLLSMAFM